MEVKECIKCQETKPLTEYHKSNAAPSGYQARCKDCRKGYWKLYKEGKKSPSRKEQVYKDGLKPCNKCGEYKQPSDFYNDASTLWDGKHSRCKACMYLDTIRKRYGVEFEDEMKRVNNCCEICNIDLTGKKVHFDHCHTRNKFRGVLCTNCNLGIGHLQDDPKVLQSAIKYLGNL